MSSPSMVDAISLYSGIGGLDLAARALGLDVRLATDIDGVALALLREALKTPTLTGDIGALLSSGDLAASWPGRRNPAVLFGGPPCTPFSHAGFWMDHKRNGQDPAASLLGRFAEAVELLSPQAFVLENVPGLAFKTHRPKLESFVHRMKKASYVVTDKVLSADAFSVPQRRRRLFVVGTRDSDPVRVEDWPRFPLRTAGMALAGLTADTEPDERIGGEYGELLRRVPVGGNYLHFTDRYGYTPPRFRNRGRYWSFLLKIDPNKPAPTLPAHRVTYNGPFHWESRHLRVREIARLQGFPDDYPLSPNRALARRHLGNAVPPALGAAVLWRVLTALDLADIDRPPEALLRWTDLSGSYAEALGAFSSVAA